MEEADSNLDDPYPEPGKIYAQDGSHILPDGWNFFSAIRIRCSVLFDNGMERFLLDYHRIFLPVIGGVLWILFLLIQK